MNENDFNLIIDSSNIPEVAKFIATSSSNAYITFTNTYNINNSGIIGYENDEMYLGIKNDNIITKLLSLDSSNIISHRDLIPKNNNLNLGNSQFSYSNIYCSNIYANNIILNNNLSVNLRFSTLYQLNNVIYSIEFIGNNNYFTVPYSGIYSINFSLYSNNNNNSTIWINKSNNFIDYNNRYATQDCTGNNNTISITMLLNKNETIYFCINKNTSSGTSVTINPDANGITTANIILINKSNN
jgi:hypothetical protein